MLSTEKAQVLSIKQASIRSWFLFLVHFWTICDILKELLLCTFSQRLIFKDYRNLCTSSDVRLSTWST